MPEVQLLTQLILPITLALMMLTMGLALTLADFKRIWHEPKGVLLGIILQLVLLPAIAWGLIFFAGLFIPLSSTVIVGLIILAVCPGGATSNIISHLSGGDGALSISMTAVVSLMIPFIIPFSLSYQLHWLGQESIAVQLPILKTIFQLLLVTIVPVFIGMSLRQLWPAAIIKLEPWARKASGIIFFCLVLALLLVQWPQLSAMGVSIAVLCLGLCLSSMFLAYGAAVFNRFSVKVRKTLAIEVGIQNAGTGMFIASVLLARPELALVPLMYGLVMNIPAFVLIAINQSKQ